MSFESVGVALLPVGYVAATALILGQALPSDIPIPWESLGMGGIAIALSMWLVRDSNAKRVEEQRERTEDAKAYASRIADIVSEQHTVKLALLDMLAKERDVLWQLAMSNKKDDVKR